MDKKKTQFISGMEQKHIINILLPYVNTIDGLPVDGIKLEVLDKNIPSMCLQQLRGAVKSNINILGGYTGQFPFAIWYRINGTDSKDRLQGTNTLYDISSFFDDQTANKSFPDFGEGKTCIKIEMTASPSCDGKYEDGMEDYIAIFMLEYKQKSRL